jgi:hypothetical protein
MKEFIAKYQKAIVGTGAVAVLLICYLQQKELKRLRQYENGIEVYSEEHGKDVRLKIEDIQKLNAYYKLQMDSLKSEDFVKSTIIGRYEVALELFKEKNKKGAEQFELIMSTQTE